MQIILRCGGWTSGAHSDSAGQDETEGSFQQLDGLELYIFIYIYNRILYVDKYFTYF